MAFKKINETALIKMQTGFLIPVDYIEYFAELQINVWWENMARYKIRQ